MAGAVEPFPAAFRAIMVTVYLVPFVRPETEQASGCTSVATDVEHVAPPGCNVTVYPVIGEPPSEDGADHETVA